MKTIKKMFILFTAIAAVRSVAQNNFPSSGNAGVGTASPTVPFEIGTTLTQGASIFKFGNPQQYNQIIFRDRSNSTFMFGLEANQIKIGLSGSDHKIMSTQYNAHNIELWPTVAVNSPSNILINAGANVGIGKSNPAYKLDVNGSINASQYYINGSQVTGFTNMWLASPSNTSNIYYSGGNVGIGINAPAYPFQIATTLSQGATVFNFGNAQQYNQIIFRDRGNSSFLYGAELGQIKIGLSGTEHKIMSMQYNAQNIELWPTVSVNSPSNILINAGQNVGIGNTNPQHKLDVNGSVNATQYLVNGSPLATLSGTGNTFYLPTTASLGIGTNNPQYKLDVLGDARISNNLYVGGGIIITEAITADTIHMGTGRMITGNTRIEGDVNTTGDVAVSQSLSVVGDVATNSKLTVGGNATFSGNLKNTALAGIGERIVYVDSNGNFKIGTAVGSPVSPGPCIASSNPWYEGGNFSPANNTIGTCSSTDFILKSNSNNSIWIKPDKKVGINTANPTAQFEVAGGGLLDGIKVNSSTTGGTVYEIIIGSSPLLSRFKTFADGKTYIGKFTSPTYDPNGSILTVGQQNKNDKALDLTDNTNPSSPNSFFTVNGSGYTEIIATLPNATDDVLAIKDATNANALNFRIKKNGNVQIGNKTSVLHPNSELLVNGTITCKELYVTKPADWPDYVFENDYKLLSLNEVEVFYKKEKHLPNVPSEKELLEKDLSVGEMNAILLRKIEELTLYSVELSKELKEVKSELTNFKKGK